MIQRIGALAAVLVLATGCSVFAVSTPRERPSAPPLRCKAVSAAPFLDAIVGGFALAFGAAITISDQRSEGEFQGILTVVAGIPLLGIGALYGLSSTYGFVQTTRCRRFHRELGIPITPRAGPR
jgi:hypothetical protein